MQYELRIARNSAREAFGRKRDLVLLVLGLPLLAAAAVQGLREGLPPGAAMPWMAAAAGAALGLSIGGAAEQRLRHLRQHSVVAPLALQRGEALAYRLQWHVPALLLGLAVTALLGASVPLMVLGHVLGAALGTTGISRLTGLRLRGTRASGNEMRADLRAKKRGARIRQLLVRSAGLARGGLLPNMLLHAAGGGAAALPYVLLATPAAAFASGAALLALLTSAGRQHPPLWRYLLYLGVPPLGASTIPAVLAAAALAGFVSVLSVARAVPWLPALGAGAALLTSFLVIAALRACHYATKPRALADLALQLDLLAAAIAGLLALPLVPPLVLARLIQLELRARSMRYRLP